jgi:rhomboid family GlyGly-CTERM serine protease
LTQHRWAWPAACAFAATGALLTSLAPPDALDWQPALAWSQPWRMVSAAWVHWSARHLAMNLAGCALIAVLGWRAQAGWPAVRAWALAWPLSQLGLLAQPTLRHYGGLSGVLHAAAAILGCHLIARGADRRSRVVGALLAVGLVAKVLSETPWGDPVRPVDGWDFLLAPAAHASGVLAGLLAWALVGRDPRTASHPP